MAAQVLTPDYSMLAKAPQPGIGTAISSGLQAYGQISKIQRARAATQLAQQQEVRQEKQAALDAQVKTLQIHTAKRDIMQNRFADLAQTPDDQKESEYQKIKSEAQQFGLNHESLPDHYNDEVGTEANTAYQKSTQAAEARKNENAVHMQNLKNAGALQAAQAKAQTAVEVAKQKAQIAAQAAPAQATVKAEAATFTDDMKAAKGQSTQALDMNQKIDTALTALSNYENKTGPLVGKWAWKFSGDGQQLQRALRSIGLQNLAGAKGIRNWYEFKEWLDNIGSTEMYTSAIRARLNEARKATQLRIGKYQYYNQKIQEGKDRPTKIMADWDSHVNQLMNPKAGVSAVQATQQPQQQSVKASDGNTYNAQDLDRIIAGGGK